MVSWGKCSKCLDNPCTCGHTGDTVDKIKETYEKEVEEDKKKLDEIEKIIYQYGQIDGGHHKMWVIDQIMRIIKGDKYEEFVHNYQYTDEDGNPTEDLYYSWDEGIAP